MTDVATALHDLLNEHNLPLDVAMQRHFSDEYRQRTDGSWQDRAGFVEHIAHLRTVVDHISVDVLDELTNGTTYADRHVVRIRKVGGAEVVHEVYLFGQMAADGRFSEIEEVTLMLSGAEVDRGIGSAC